MLHFISLKVLYNSISSMINFGYLHNRFQTYFKLLFSTCKNSFRIANFQRYINTNYIHLWYYFTFFINHFLRYGWLNIGLCISSWLTIQYQCHLYIRYIVSSMFYSFSFLHIHLKKSWKVLTIICDHT